MADKLEKSKAGKGNVEAKFVHHQLLSSDSFPNLRCCQIILGTKQYLDLRY